MQRVRSADVTVAGEVAGAIGAGLCVLVGVTHADGPDQARRLAEKLWHLRVFDDEAGVMNRSVADTSREVLVVSQFTLYGDASKGRRPSFVDAAPPDQARALYLQFIDQLRAQGCEVATGEFGADMAVDLVNDGPVTLWLER